MTHDVDRCPARGELAELRRQNTELRREVVRLQHQRHTLRGALRESRRTAERHRLRAAPFTADERSAISLAVAHQPWTSSTVLDTVLDLAEAVIAHRRVPASKGDDHE